MGQQEVIDVLKKAQRPMTSREIAKELEASIYKVSRIINRLLKHGEVSFTELDLKETRERYGVNQKFRLYMVVKDRV
jgi:predicted transcriptional regulator